MVTFSRTCQVFTFSSISLIIAPADYNHTVVNLTFVPSGPEVELVLVETRNDDVWESMENFQAVIAATSPSVSIGEGEAEAVIDADFNDGRFPST